MNCTPSPKAQVYENLYTTSALTTMLPWQIAQVEEVRATMGDDWWPYGFRGNRAVLDTFLRYHHEQGLSRRRLEPEERFVDRQLKGPYSLWRHTHTFEEVEGGTRMTDHVEYAVPLGPLGSIARAIFVTRMVEKIFDYRARVIGERFAL